jgi:cytochrome c biogenesis protein
MKIKIFKMIANLKFAIILLITIVIIILLGSIIEQDKSLEFYQQNYPEKKLIFGFLNWKFIQFTGIDHLYRTPWFIFLLLIFALSLITCTFLQQFPIIKFSRRCNFKKIKTFNISASINYTNIGNFLNKVILNGYITYQQKTNLYSTKGLIGRISPIFVHFSILLILFGSIISALGGFNVQELIPKSEIFHVQNTISSGFLSKFPEQAIRINDFWINYYKDNKIKQFYSNISILNEIGTEITNKTISVNKPLIYKNLTLYQTDWTIIGIRIKENNKYFELPVIFFEKQKNKVFITWLPINIKKDLKQKPLNGKTILLQNYKETVFIYNLLGNFESDNDIYEFLINNNYKTIDLLVSSGLQIKSDPGIFFIYFGFGFLMINTFLSYISFSQIWGFKDKEKNKTSLNIYAKTNRDKYVLNLEIANAIIKGEK